jgi:hypothetical protein
VVFAGMDRLFEPAGEFGAAAGGEAELFRSS